MADIFAVNDIVQRMADGFQPAVLSCLAAHADLAVEAVQEQLYSGVDGEERYLSPSYDDDPYFEEEGRWYHRSQDYKKWKAEITPPQPGIMLMLAPRPLNIPNLYINGQFYDDIFAEMQGEALSVGFRTENNAPEIVSKYDGNILRLGPTAIGYLNQQYVLPYVFNFFEECGY